ncbi:TPA: hypothetical protein I7702_16805 [Vibrio vulnificus]|nr:hypothetical protein [Vibrio vulnificus]HAS8460820.1 hypothetical protein [Vibrio vulnificus]
MSSDNPLERLDCINVVNTITRHEQLPDDVCETIRLVTKTALTSHVDVTQATHFIDQLTKPSSTEPNITLHSLFGGTKQAINNIVREEVITHMNSLARERDKEL